MCVYVYIVHDLFNTELYKSYCYPFILYTFLYFFCLIFFWVFFFILNYEHDKAKTVAHNLTDSS